MRFQESKVPEWILDHPELKARGIILDHPVKPVSSLFVSPVASLSILQDVAWRTGYDDPGRPYVIKTVKSSSPEADIYEKLLRFSSASPNHTLPCKVIRSHPPLLIMPALSEFTVLPFHEWSFGALLRGFDQVLEGVEFLHQLKIAHLDCVTDNFLYAKDRDVAKHAGSDMPVEAGKVYIMDFGQSRQFELGPGHQPAIKLPASRIDAPLGMTHFDPFSWDMLSVGHSFAWISDWAYSDRPPKSWILRRYVQWVIGNERGCTTVCHCRPTARRARQVLRVILLALETWEACGRIVKFCMGAFGRRTAPT
ncbi:hypothetical protein C8Q76DRAFT_665209 [Earliella scabrosa]|nr:hypothetical protein C8Q76DRAFT_665209 [Earliella scabrosa]